MTISTSDLQRIVQTIWSIQLGIELEPADPSKLRLRADTPDAILIRARFSGQFTGELLQLCSQRLSLTAARAAFSASGRQPGPSEATDVMTELANMTSGNVKTMLPRETSVQLTTNHDEWAEELEPISETGFVVEGEPLIVTLSRCPTRP
jgi:hypothetical protein